MKVLITGAGGFLGHGIVTAFEGHHELRLIDVAPFERPGHEVIVGSVADLETVRRAVKGMDALVIAHMASRQARAYDTPTVPFDANVKGTVHLLFAAAEEGIRRVVLISSTGVVQERGETGGFLTRDLPYKLGGTYRLTKVIQEIIARQYHEEHGMAVAVLRVGCIMNADVSEDKYGRKFFERSAALTDRRDIGEVARLSLELADLAWEIFYVMSTDEALEVADIAYTRERLGWMPKHKFTHLPMPVPGGPARPPRK